MKAPDFRPRGKSVSGSGILEQSMEHAFEPGGEGVLCLGIAGGPEERENGGNVEMDGEENTGESPTAA